MGPMRTRLAGLALVLALSAAAAPLALAAEPDGFRVVVHPSNKGALALTRAQVSQIFLKKTTRWPDARRILPVEPADLDTRERFARKVHSKSALAVKSFWNQQIFAGREVPPLEKATDGEVLAYVKANAEAIGYVSPSADVGGLAVLPLKE
jgi:ABC-type phosphate transport system substrate-binding protein